MLEVDALNVLTNQDEEWERAERVQASISSRFREGPFELGYLQRDNFPSEFRYYTGEPTGRTIEEVSNLHGFEFDDFIRWIDRKVVLDVGGGYSMLQTAATTLGLDTTIYNLDLPSTFTTDKWNRSKFIKKVTENEIVGVAHQMPIASSSMDIILATYSVPFWSHSADHVEDLVNEALRVIKPGGVISISPFIAGTSYGDKNTNLGSLRLYSMLRSMSTMPKLELSFTSELRENPYPCNGVLRITKLAELSL